VADDPHWPRASDWLAAGAAGAEPDVGVLGVPAHATSLSVTQAHTTPTAVRAALSRYSTFLTSRGQDLRDLRAVDLGDVSDPDSDAGEQRTQDAVARFTGALLVALGGDNSITYAVARGARATGLITLDAHHDLRDGRSNGSPVRRLVDAGLPGERIVQIGIADFSNSAQYARRAREYGITVISRHDVAVRGITDVMAQALAVAGAGEGARVHVDLDVDVCDRSVVPACPAAAPGGLSAHELRLAARIAGADPRVVSLDLTEVDAAADAPDGRTVRLVALCLLEAAGGLLHRR
jgi:formiminoglutamase